MLYDINLRITYTYEVPVSGGRHVVRVLPVSLPDRQRLVAGTVTCTPGPERTQGQHRFLRQSLHVDPVSQAA